MIVIGFQWKINMYYHFKLLATYIFKVTNSIIDFSTHLRGIGVPFSTLGLFLVAPCAWFTSGLPPVQPSHPLLKGKELPKNQGDTQCSCFHSIYYNKYELSMTTFCDCFQKQKWSAFMTHCLEIFCPGLLIK